MNFVLKVVTYARAFSTEEDLPSCVMKANSTKCYGGNGDENNNMVHAGMATKQFIFISILTAVKCYTVGVFMMRVASAAINNYFFALPTSHLP